MTQVPASGEGAVRGEVIEYLRRRRGMTQREVGERVGYQGPSVGVAFARVEKGFVDPGPEGLSLIAEVLGCSRVEFDHLVATWALGSELPEPVGPGLVDAGGSASVVPDGDALPVAGVGFGEWPQIVEETGFLLREGDVHVRALWHALAWARSGFLEPLVDELTLIDGLHEAEEYSKVPGFPSLDLEPGEGVTGGTDEELNSSYARWRAAFEAGKRQQYGLEALPDGWVPATRRAGQFLAGLVHPAYLVDEPVRWQHRQAMGLLAALVGARGRGGAVGGADGASPVLESALAESARVTLDCLSRIRGPLAGRGGVLGRTPGAVTADVLVSDLGRLCVTGVAAIPVLMAMGSRGLEVGRDLGRDATGEERMDAASSALQEAESTMGRLWDWCQRQEFLLLSSMSGGEGRLDRLRTDVTYGKPVAYATLSRRQRAGLRKAMDLAGLVLLVMSMPTALAVYSGPMLPRESATVEAWFAGIAALRGSVLANA